MIRRSLPHYLFVSLSILFVVTFLSTTIVLGQTVQLPRTGQAKCYDTIGTEINCAGTGQDGEYQAGIAWPSPRFTSGTGNEADCMIDNLTGLMWPRNGNIAGAGMLWNDAIDNANNLTLCGFSDWRLPNLNELESLLINADQVNLADWLGSQGFIDVQQPWGASGYWSSTWGNTPNSPARAWFVGTDGWTETGNKYLDYYYFWPVRGENNGPARLWKTGQTYSYREGDDGYCQKGTAWPTQRFTVNGDCVADNLTGLVWSMDANLSGIALTWNDALDYANNLTLCGHSDWRLPNRKEFMSLFDRSTQYLPVDHPFVNVVSEYYTCEYWTSTYNWQYRSSTVWSVWMYKGSFFWDTLEGLNYLWPVRGGQITPPHISPTIDMYPLSGPPGTTFTEGGSGFTPNSTATLHFLKADGITEYPTSDVTVTAEGTFTILYTAPSDKPIGSYAWWAIDGPTGISSNQVTYTISALGTKPKIHGLFVGVQDSGEWWQFTLRGDKMAAALEEIFRKSLSATGDYGSSDVLTGTVTEDGGLTAYDVNLKLDALRPNMAPGDTLWLYISAHGGFDDTGTETTENTGDEGVVLGHGEDGRLYDDRLYLFLNDDKWGDLNKWVFIDSCHAGGFWGNKNDEDEGDLEKLKNIVLIVPVKEGSTKSDGISPFDIFTGYPLFGLALYDGLKLEAVVEGKVYLKADTDLRDGILTPDEIINHYKEFHKTREGYVYPMDFGDYGEPVMFTPDILEPQTAKSDDFTYNINYRVNIQALRGGSVGTQVTIDGSGFGCERGKVLIGGLPTKIAPDGWTDTAITFEVKKPLPASSYNMVVMPKEPKGAFPITYEGGFVMMAPEITSVDPSSGLNPNEIVISGNYFGTKRGKIYLENTVTGKKKRCKITAWGMDSITFIAPKTSKRFPAKEYLLKVVNKVGEDSTTFTVE